MKKLLTLFPLLLLQISVHAQPNIAWQKALGGSNDEEFFDCKQAPDGGYILIGTTKSQDGNVSGFLGETDTWIVKTDVTGVIQWSKTYGDDSIDVGKSIELTPDGGYIFTGYKHTYISYDFGASYSKTKSWLVKLDADGNIQWEKTYGTGKDIAEEVKLTADGGYIFTATSNTSDFWVVKTDKNGTEMWRKNYGGSSIDLSRSIDVTPDGGCIVGGHSTSIDGDLTNYYGNGDYWLVKLDKDGNMQWQKTYGGSQYEQIMDVITTYDGGYAAVGRSLSNNGQLTSNKGYYDGWIIKTDANGTLQWQQSYGSTGSDGFRSIKQLVNGNYIIVGNADSANGNVTSIYGSTDIWMMELYGNGSIKWQRTIGGTNYDIANSVSINKNGSMIICGITISNDGDASNSGYHGGWDGWVIKTASIVSVNDVQEESKTLIYPTVTNGTITVELAKEMQNADVRLINLMGQTLHIDNLGQSKRTVDLSSYPAGNYMIQIINGVDKEVHKVVYMP